jgi:YidC/Oxa1 family membrane protein insertase
MDSKSLRQFLIISALLMTGWYLFMKPAESPNRPGAGPVQPVRPGGASLIPGIDAVAGPGPTADPDIPVVHGQMLQNSRIRTVWTNRQASLQSLTLVGITAPFKRPGAETRDELALLREFQAGVRSDAIVGATFTNASGLPQTEQVSLHDVTYRIEADSAANTITFTSPPVADARGRSVRIRKTVSLAEDEEFFRVSISTENVSGAGVAPFSVSLSIRGAAGVEREELLTRYIGTRVGTRTDDSYDIADISSTKLDKLQARNDPGYPRVNQSAGIAWAAVINHYFVTVHQPDEGSLIRSVSSHLVVDADMLDNQSDRWPAGSVRRDADRPKLARMNAGIVIQTQPMHPGGEFSYRFLTVPRELKSLTPHGSGLKGMVEFGWFGGISKLVLRLLGFFEWMTGSYGLAILMVTVIVRIVLHPLTRKSQIGMIKMQKLQPQIKEMQRKYPNDRQKHTEEQMKLFRRYGVSPLGGCMPMLLQMPVFIALFRALRQAYVLRQTSFLYIDDLSLPDAAFTLSFHLPLLGNQINILPLLMVGLMLMQQRMMHQPAATEQAAQQQKMMKWMPVFFGFIFYKMPSGLCLYWATSTAIGVGERMLVERHAREIELEPKDEAGAKRGTGPTVTVEEKPKRIGWMQKLQSMVDEQSKKQVRASKAANRHDKKKKKK